MGRTGTIPAGLPEEYVAERYGKLGFNLPIWRDFVETNRASLVALEERVEQLEAWMRHMGYRVPEHPRLAPRGGPGLNFRPCDKGGRGR